MDNGSNEDKQPEKVAAASTAPDKSKEALKEEPKAAVKTEVKAESEAKAKAEPKSKEQPSASSKESPKEQPKRDAMADDKQGGKPRVRNRKSKSPPLLSDSVAKSQKVRRGPVWMAFMFAIIAAGVAGYTFYQLQQYKYQDAANSVPVRDPAIDAVTEDLRRANDRLAASLLRQDDQQRLVDELGLRVNSLRRSLSDITNVSRQSWLLAEAEYLIRLANQRLTMEQEAASALALLEAADQILLEVDDIALFPVRKTLAEEMVALRGAGNLDTQGLFLRLSALTKQAETLKLIAPTFESEAVVTEETTPVLTKLENWVKRYVQVQQRDVPVKPLLSPEQHYYVQQNLRLMLEQAQLALLQRRQPLYLESLTKARLWVGEYFELNDSANAIVENLTELQQFDVAPELPDISQSLRQLKDVAGQVAPPTTPSAQDQAAVQKQSQGEAANQTTGLAL